jgi:hypothetical protein
MAIPLQPVFETGFPLLLQLRHCYHKDLPTSNAGAEASLSMLIKKPRFANEWYSLPGGT